jgi:hypothetical protein
VAGDEDTKLTDSISNSLEPNCRQLLYALHNKRYALLIGVLVSSNFSHTIRK